MLFIYYYLIHREVLDMGNRKSKVSITLDNELISELKNYAYADDRSFSQYINIILKCYVKKLQEKEQKKRS